MPPPPVFTTATNAHRFSWDLTADRAELTNLARNEPVWSGSLLPLLWLNDQGQLRAVKATARADASSLSANAGRIALDLGAFGAGQLEFTAVGNAVKITRLEIDWRTPSAAEIHSLYFGCDLLTPAQRQAVPSLERPLWPNWRAEGFAVASAKTNPMQSFFRSWDFGHTDIALGSFGPAMGTPYSAAFPRPTYAACAGGRNGWVCFGAGIVPDAAVTFQVRARSAAIEWRYREDLWKAPPDSPRVWTDPLWLTWADSAWHAYRDYFRLFPPTSPKPASHQKTFWGTWGDFRVNEFELRSSIDRAVDQMEADLICIDDPWEAAKGSCRPHPDRLPNFSDDIAYAHERKLGVGIWMPMVWLEDFAAEGLTTDDLLLSRDGLPVRSNWAVDPHEAGQAFYCLDPSTPGTQRFLRERTQRVVRAYRPTLLKIDFGYGVPGPDACTPRDPSLRGERLAWTFARLIAQAAHELDPSITVLGYSLHPLWAEAQDEISLDDLGDAGAHEATGHGQWSIWAALAGERGSALMGSSGYLWEADPDVLMNSAILGAPGANLPRARPDGTPLPAAHLARRRAVFRWHRRTTRWEPLWLDSRSGNLQEEPTVRNWGRVEIIAGERAVTALALRDPSPAALAEPLINGLRWTGRWIVLAQGAASIFTAREVALIPLAAGTIELPSTKPAAVQAIFADRASGEVGATFDSGRMAIHANDALLAQPLLGFLLRREG